MGDRIPRRADSLQSLLVMIPGRRSEGRKNGSRDGMKTERKSSPAGKTKDS